MNCPRCQTSPLIEKERDGVQVDACAGCHGLWLDRGELEKLIARTARDDRELDDDDGQPGERARKRGFFASLGDLFD